jgi:hypothetical protein
LERQANVPCKNCFLIPMCKNTPFTFNMNVPTFLHALMDKCSLIKDYLKLKDLGLDIPKDYTPMIERRYYTVPLSTRIKKVCKLMGIEKEQYKFWLARRPEDEMD